MHPKGVDMSDVIKERERVCVICKAKLMQGSPAYRLLNANHENEIGPDRIVCKTCYGKAPAAERKGAEAKPKAE